MTIDNGATKGLKTVKDEGQKKTRRSEESQAKNMLNSPL
jgi:hypothetical protein